jgi:hypothetical protein
MAPTKKGEREMKTAKAGIKVKSNVKAGLIWHNHSPVSLKIKSKVKAGLIWHNHNVSVL